ncbi:hypothetical protein AB0M57_24775 [Streptomyces sp. NPDC051597]|uniref:hypothetical protein n=1 Tax=Streptomyces sp. NPDC051597 TaxID=3155049 RepID=UPI003424BCD1
MAADTQSDDTVHPLVAPLAQSIVSAGVGAPITQDMVNQARALQQSPGGNAHPVTQNPASPADDSRGKMGI